MITFLRISNLGVIDTAGVDLRPGMVALTGETGAGKTMVVTALDLLFGGRAGSAAVRSGAQSAWVEAGFDADLPQALAERLRDAGAEPEPGEDLLLSRTLTAGRSRAQVAGRSVPAAVLRDIGEAIVARHGQHDQQRLAVPARRRELLDAHGGGPVALALHDYRHRYDTWQRLRADLDALQAETERARAEIETLRFGLQEIAAVDPQPGEDDELAAQTRRLEHAVDLRHASEGAASILRSDDVGESDVASALAEAARQVDIAAAMDPALAPIARDIETAAVTLTEAASALRHYSSAVVADPQHLDRLHERRAALAGLQRKYGPTLDDVLRWAGDAARRAALVDDSDAALDRLQRDLGGAGAALGAAADALHAARAAAAADLGARVTAELAALAMPDARFEVRVDHRADAAGLLLPGAQEPVAFGPSGTDLVAFHLRPHPGAPARPVTEAASGGEISRVMLALHVVLAAADAVPVMVFDEIDAGVGGAAAVEVGRRLARLARHAQVLVVTHLPQVAAFADQHVVVAKSTDGVVTSSSITVVEGPDRLRELARMLAGLAESESAAMHAQELLDLAAAERADTGTRGAVMGGSGRAR